MVELKLDLRTYCECDVFVAGGGPAGCAAAGSKAIQITYCILVSMIPQDEARGESKAKMAKNWHFLAFVLVKLV